jgi:hypothetical protein
LGTCRCGSEREYAQKQDVRQCFRQSFKDDFHDLYLACLVSNHCRHAFCPCWCAGSHNRPSLHFRSSACLLQLRKSDTKANHCDAHTVPEGLATTPPLGSCLVGFYGFRLRLHPGLPAVRLGLRPDLGPDHCIPKVASPPRDTKGRSGKLTSVEHTSLNSANGQRLGFFPDA